ncbi:hypothetical protein PpBr36_03405 [Pyricularia pennisetigena]|uniref:hypothetical protein n=1 Tax=Pyricularia pennisetigena TaxID=1578925 RepID=UPI00114EEAC6|nr:hypothetical protein PpBr36_03405 [Pyricularia pennisetigena]TLS30438.1 hypothetical protein PpBr36_03405 [Pyricularia pennisetigena]
MLQRETSPGDGIEAATGAVVGVVASPLQSIMKSCDWGYSGSDLSCSVTGTCDMRGIRLMGRVGMDGVGGVVGQTATGIWLAL